MARKTARSAPDLPSMMGSKDAVAAVEFALIAPLFCLIVLAAADLAIAFNRKIQIVSGISSVAYYAFTNGQSINTESDATTLISNAKNLFTSLVSADDLALTLDFQVNSSATGATAANYYCVSGYPATYTHSASGASCGSNLAAGKYFTISVTGNVTPYFSYNNFFGSYLQIQQTLIVRLV